MDEETNIKDHINKFFECITQLLSVEVKSDEHDQIIILMISLSNSYETLVTTF